MQPPKETPHVVEPSPQSGHKNAGPKLPKPETVPAGKASPKKPSLGPPVNEDQILKWLTGPEEED